VLVTTLNKDGTSNIAPKCWASMVASDPPTRGFNCTRGHWTAQNILRRKELVLKIPGAELAFAVWATIQLDCPRPVGAAGSGVSGPPRGPSRTAADTRKGGLPDRPDRGSLRGRGGGEGPAPIRPVSDVRRSGGGSVRHHRSRPSRPSAEASAEAIAPIGPTATEKGPGDRKLRSHAHLAGRAGSWPERDSFHRYRVL
jgi:hypothetical protein